MKTIEVSDEDYEVLMSLSKELQLQDNNGQAFPYFWEPSSEKLVPNINDEGKFVVVYDPDACEEFSLSQYSESNFPLWMQYLLNEKHEFFSRDYSESDEREWMHFIESSGGDVRIYTQDWERQCEHNPSLFMSDVEQFCETNSHHLGRKPHTYSRSVWRMPKMESLVGAIYRMNKQPKESVNEEARRFVYKNDNERN